MEGITIKDIINALKILNPGVKWKNVSNAFKKIFKPLIKITKKQKKIIKKLRLENEYK